MFVGHYGISFVAKSRRPDIPLWVLFIAVQVLDVFWAIFVLLGIEKVRIVPGYTASSPLDLYYMPYTHGLPGSIAVSLLLGVIVSVFTPGNRARTMLLVAAASFSHWVLDFLVHVPDLPLYDNTAKVGLGLWRHVALSFPLELFFLGLGAWFYASRTTFAGMKGRNLFFAFVVFLGLVQIYANFGPPPPSMGAMAISAFGLYLGLAALAAFVERIATRQPEAGAAELH